MEFPSEWRDILSKVQQLYPRAIIAGGALRDSILGAEIKDVDIFIPVDKDSGFENIYDVLPDAELYKDHTYGRVKGINLEEDTRDIHCIYVLKDPILLYSYDLIFCTPEAANIDTFDINICQINWDGENGIASDAFWKGAADKHIKIMNINRTDRNKKRLDRIRAKYPDFTYEEA